jgi:ribosomal protein S18 acetylase RimI-like enzyme
MTVSSAPAEAQVQLISASQFTIEQLTAAYNQTRVDYLVPMPMNAARLAEYIYVYDVDLSGSVVAVDHETILGLAMLGMRPGRGWVTRMGVLPVSRRRGVGRMLLDHLLETCERRGVPHMVLEVIQNNEPAYNLFLSSGFTPLRELLVMRRPPGPPSVIPQGEAAWYDHADALRLLERRSDQPSWITETESIARAPNIQVLTLALPDGGQGWLVFQAQTMRGIPLLLSRLTLHTEAGDPTAVACHLLAHLYNRFPDLDTHIENVADADSHLPAYRQLGFFESFRRIEMCRTPQCRTDPATHGH